MDSSFLLLPDAPAYARSRNPQFPANAADVSMHLRRYGARQRIFTAGDAARAIHEVAQGCVLVSRHLRDGRRQIIDIVGPGRLFGFALNHHSCTAEAIVASMVCSLDRDTAQASPAIAPRVHAAILRELDHMRDLAVILGRKSALERVATLLMALAGEETHRPVHLLLPISRTEMADYLGLTIETVSRSLSRMKQTGLISFRDAESIQVLNPDELRSIAQEALEDAA